MSFRVEVQTQYLGPRDRLSGLAIDDLDLVAQLANAQTVTAAARQLKIKRPVLYRLIARINRLAGAKLSWRSGTKYAPPAEVMRLARHHLLDEMYSTFDYPRVSAGSLTSLRFAEIIFTNRIAPAPRVHFVRTRDVNSSLLKYDIDLALLHRVPENPDLDFVPAPGLQLSDLVRWRAVLVSPREPISEARPVLWERSSSAYLITFEACRLCASFGQLLHCTREQRHLWRAPSYLGALEAARRSIPVRFVIPDFLLTAEDIQRTEVQHPDHVDKSLCGVVTAVYRPRDWPRLQQFLDPELWSAFSHETK